MSCKLGLGDPCLLGGCSDCHSTTRIEGKRSLDAKIPQPSLQGLEKKVLVGVPQLLGEEIRELQGQGLA